VQREMQMVFQTHKTMTDEKEGLVVENKTISIFLE
jgi:hypothetical protein